MGSEDSAVRSEENTDRLRPLRQFTDGAQGLRLTAFGSVTDTLNFVTEILFPGWSSVKQRPVYRVWVGLACVGVWVYLSVSGHVCLCMCLRWAH